MPDAQSLVGDASVSSASASAATISALFTQGSSHVNDGGGDGGGNDDDQLASLLAIEPSPFPNFDTIDAPYLLYTNLSGNILVAIVLGAISVFTIVGNCMVVWAIFNYRPLHNVQNMYMVSLAVADIAVAVTVMPLNIAYYLLDKWIFGLVLCEVWLTSDV